MGQLALGLGGGLVGSFFGMPQLGFLAGSLIGGFLFPAKGANQQGPRLDNLSVTSSTYGSPIFIIYGTVRTGGNIIWNGFDPPIKEKAHKEKQQGAKGGIAGGAGGSVTTYTYSWTGGIGICEGPIDSIIRIWADSKLVYDATAGGVLNKKKKTLRFRLYKGTEDQLPDPAHEDAVDAENAQAYRGLAYIVFDNIPLADYGNRVPSFSFEVVATAAGNSNGVVGVTDLTGGPASDPSDSFILPDWDRNRFYKFDATSVHVYSIASNKEIQQATADSVFEPDDEFALAFSGEIAVDTDGYLYAQAGGGGANTAPIVKINPFTLQEIARVGTASSNLNPAGTGNNICIKGDSFAIVTSYTPTGKNSYLISCTFNGHIQIFYCTDQFSFAGYIDSAELDEFKGYPVPGETTDGNANCYIVGRAQFGPEDNGPLGVYKITMPGTAFQSIDDTRANPDITMDKLGEIDPNEVVSWWTYFSTFFGSFYDTHEQRLYIIVQGGRFYTDHTVQIIRYDANNDVVDWVVPIDVTFTEKPQFIRATSGVVSFVGTNNFGDSTTSVQTIDLATGESNTTTGWDFLHASGGGQTYDSELGAIIAPGTTTSTVNESNCILYTGRGSAGSTTDGTIVADLCDRIGFQPADYDVTELIDEVPGYVINNQMTVRSAIEPLALAFFFDGVESDDILKFRKRGQAHSFALGPDDLGWVGESEGVIVQETRAQEVEMPERVSTVYLDRDLDYEQNTMTSKRVSNPTPTMYSRNQVSHTFPMVLDAEMAKKMAERLLFSSWIERVQEEFNTAWDWLKLDPVDSGTVTLSDGTVYAVRIVGVDVGVDWSMQFKAVSEDATSYVSNVAASAGDGFPTQTIPGPTTTRTFLMDSPLLRDMDDTNGKASRLYCAAGGFGGSGWPGEQLMFSADGSFYAPISTMLQEVSWGAIASPLGAPEDPFVTDEANILTVFMVTGGDNLESVTMLEMMNGANAAMVLNTSTGVLEIIQFRDVALNTDGSYTLSGLNRGRRGTDVYTDTHDENEVFILLELDPVESFTLALGSLNVVRYYKGVPYSTFFEDADLITFTATGRDLKPYAPWGVAAATAGGDIALTWQRRTRIGGDLRDATGTVPLAETTEAYEIDIYNGSAIVRTLTSVTNSKTYLAADITTDFGGAQTSLKLAVYQMSEAVGRGFGYIQTIAVAP